MKKYTNKILVVAGILLLVFFVIITFWTYSKLEKEGKILPKSQLTTGTVEEEEDVEVIE